MEDLLPEPQLNARASRVGPLVAHSEPRSLRARSRAANEVRAASTISGGAATRRTMPEEHRAPLAERAATRFSAGCSPTSSSNTKKYRRSGPSITAIQEAAAVNSASAMTGMMRVARSGSREACTQVCPPRSWPANPSSSSSPSAVVPPPPELRVLAAAASSAPCAVSDQSPEGRPGAALPSGEGRKSIRPWRLNDSRPLVSVRRSPPTTSRNSITLIGSTARSEAMWRCFLVRNPGSTADPV